MRASVDQTEASPVQTRRGGALGSAELLGRLPFAPALEVSSRKSRGIAPPKPVRAVPSD